MSQAHNYDFEYDHEHGRCAECNEQHHLTDYDDELEAWICAQCAAGPMCEACDDAPPLPNQSLCKSCYLAGEGYCSGCGLKFDGCICSGPEAE